MIEDVTVGVTPGPAAPGALGLFLQHLDMYYRTFRAIETYAEGLEKFGSEAAARATLEALLSEGERSIQLMRETLAKGIGAAPTASGALPRFVEVQKQEPKPEPEIQEPKRRRRLKDEITPVAPVAAAATAPNGAAQSSEAQPSPVVEKPVPTDEEREREHQERVKRLTEAAAAAKADLQKPPEPPSPAEAEPAPTATAAPAPAVAAPAPASPPPVDVPPPSAGPGPLAPKPEDVVLPWKEGVYANKSLSECELADLERIMATFVRGVGSEPDPDKRAAKSLWLERIVAWHKYRLDDALGKLDRAALGATVAHYKALADMPTQVEAMNLHRKAWYARALEFQS